MRTAQLLQCEGIWGKWAWRWISCEKCKIKAQLHLLVFIATLFHNFGLVIKKAKRSYVFYIWTENYIKGQFTKLSLAGLLRNKTLQNLWPGAFSKQLAEILLKSNFRPGLPNSLVFTKCVNKYCICEFLA